MSPDEIRTSMAIVMGSNTPRESFFSDSRICPTLRATVTIGIIKKNPDEIDTDSIAISS